MTYHHTHQPDNHSINSQPEKTTMSKPPEANAPTPCELLLQQAEAMVALGRQQIADDAREKVVVKNPLERTHYMMKMDGLPVFVHRARTCANCAALDPVEGCENGYGSDALVCPEHVTHLEDHKNVHQPHRPPLALVKGGVAC